MREAISYRCWLSLVKSGIFLALHWIRKGNSTPVCQVTAKSKLRVTSQLKCHCTQTVSRSPVCVVSSQYTTRLDTAYTLSIDHTMTGLAVELLGALSAQFSRKKLCPSILVMTWPLEGNGLLYTPSPLPPQLAMLLVHRHYLTFLSHPSKTLGWKESTLTLSKMKYIYQHNDIKLFHTLQTIQSQFS